MPKALCTNPASETIRGSDPRDGEHKGAVACARVNRMASAASWSSRGLDTSEWP